MVTVAGAEGGAAGGVSVRPLRLKASAGGPCPADLHSRGGSGRELFSVVSRHVFVLETLSLLQWALAVRMEGWRAVLGDNIIATSS